MPEEQALYNANDGLTGRDGGPYLDVEEDRRAEVIRARIEKREPDLDNPPASAGTVLVTARQALENAGVNNLPSQDDASASTNAEAALKGIADDEGNNLKPRAFRPEEGITPPEDEVDLSTRTALLGDTEAETPGADDVTSINESEGTPEDGIFPNDAK
jgi:hypothetical protein